MYVLCLLRTPRTKSSVNPYKISVKTTSILPEYYLCTCLSCRGARHSSEHAVRCDGEAAQPNHGELRHGSLGVLYSVARLTNDSALFAELPSPFLGLNHVSPNPTSIFNSELRNLNTLLISKCQQNLIAHLGDSGRSLLVLLRSRHNCMIQSVK